MFEYLFTLNAKEREEVEEKIVALVGEAVQDERETFAIARNNRKSTKARATYLESCQRLGGISDLLEILGMESVFEKI